MRSLLAIVVAISVSPLAYCQNLQPINWNASGREVRDDVPFGGAASSTTAAAKQMPFRVSAEQAAELIRQGYSRRIEPETGNEQWAKSLTHGEPSSSVTALFPPGGSAAGSCGSSTFKIGGS